MSKILPKILHRPEVTTPDWRRVPFRSFDEEWDGAVRPVSWSEELALVATVAGLILVVLILL